VITEFRGSERRDMDAGEAGVGSSDASMDMAMEMVTSATPVAAETAGVTIFEPIERNKNGKRRGRSEAPATPSVWKSRMERTMRQQAQELTQLHRTVGHLTNLVQVQAAREEALWLGMRMWMQERVQKWDARHEDHKLWGAGITNMIAKVMKRLAPGHEARDKERDKTAGMDGGGLEASQHVDTTQEGRPDQCEQLQQQLETRLPLKVQPKLQHEPKRKLAPTPARRWETLPPQTESQRAPTGPGGSSRAASRLILKRDESAPLPGPASTSGSSMADRRLILRRDESIPVPRKMDEEFA